MEVNEAPKKLWINPQLDLPKLNGVIDKNSVQYVRADVFIDKACEWLAKNDSYAIPTNVQVDRLREHLNNIK